MAPATAFEQARVRRLRAAMSRAQRWRWRDRCSGEPFGALFRAAIRQDPRWAVANLHMPRWLIERREANAVEIRRRNR
jgi:hypothetical protein